MSQPPYQSGYPQQPQQPQQGYPQQPQYPAQQGYPQQPQQPQYPQQQGYPQQSQYPGYSQQQPAQQYGGQQSYSPPPKKKSKSGLWITLTLVLLLVCGGLGVGGYLLYKDKIKPIADASSIRVVAPDQLGERPKITSSELAGTAEGMKASLGSDLPGATSTIAAFYGDLEKQDLVMVVGASAPLADPGKELDEAFDSMGKAGMTATGVVDVEPGALGGEARCGASEVQGTELAVCAWADHGSVGMVIFYFMDVDKAKAEFIAIREQVEIKE